MSIVTKRPIQETPAAMILDRIEPAARTGIRPLAAAVVVLAGTAFVGGCASVPDAANPAHWYRSTVDYFTGDEKKGKKEEAKGERAPAQTGPAAERDKPPPGAADQPFPKLSSVPERPPRQVAQGLVADPSRPRYAPAIPRQGEDAPPPPSRAAAPPPPAPPVAAATPAPRAPAPAPTAPAAPPPPKIAAAPPSQIAAAPTPPPAPPAPAAKPMTVQEAYRAGLAQQQMLPSQMAATTAPGVVSPSGDSLPTVVVSSGGVVMSGAPLVAAAQAPTVPRPSMPAARAPTAPDPAALAIPGRVTTGGDAGLTPAAVKIATVLFANGSSQVDARGQQVLAQVMQLHRRDGGTLRVVGHASSRTRAMDPVRHNMVNFNVSAARANAVARELIRMGARAENVFMGAVADADPRYYEVMPTGEAGNRRAEVYIDR